jgi:glycosyltransferase involved in cell wall biosynthesis
VGSVVTFADITVVTPSIPPRTQPGKFLDRAVISVREQTLRPAGGHVVILDVDKAGAAITRQRGLDAVRTEWVAFLDDDDYFYPHHLATLHGMLTEGDCDFAYSWFDGNNPFPMHRGRQMNLNEPHHTTMTVMVRTEIAQRAGFLQPDGPMHQDWAGEDWQFELRCIEEIKKKWEPDVARGKIVGTGEITWHYAVHGTNTSGLPSRW